MLRKARDDRQDDEAALRALLVEFGHRHAATLAQLDRTDRALDAALAHFAGRSTAPSGS